MKKFTGFILTIILILSICSCASEEANTGENSKPTLPDETQNVETAPTQTEATAPQITYESQKVIDNEQCSVTISGIEPDALWGYTINTLLENKSSDITYMFALNYVSVNGVMCTDTFAEEVSAGKKSNQSIHISLEDLIENGMSEATDIVLAFHIYDANDWSADPVSEEIVHIYPYGEEKADRFVRPAADTDQILVDNENISVIVTGFETDDIWGYQVKLYCVNKTDNILMYSVQDASVNGFMIDPFFATSIAPGCSEFTAFDFSDHQLQENGIETVESIEFSLHVYDEMDPMGEGYLDDVFTLVPTP